MSRARLQVSSFMEHEMANRNDNPDTGRRDDSGSGRSSGNDSGKQRDRNNNEWLRDQTGEDHNLSGSSTYRNLPDQPESDEDRGSRDASNRQSNR